jgi:hypothetical protein
LTLARDPLTFQHALTRIGAVLTTAEMARVVRRSERLVHKWMHPDERAAPTLFQALALDMAYAAAGGDGAPILETYAQQLESELGRQVASTIALSSALAVAAKECGEAIAHGLAASQPGSGPRVAHQAVVQAVEAQSAMAVVVRRLSSLARTPLRAIAFLPLGAGPRGETVGGT